jgi:hypothetical protein
MEWLAEKAERNTHRPKVLIFHSALSTAIAPKNQA